MAGAPWPAPAKLNRFLHILGRRADGYHRLQTVFQFLDYGDMLDFGIRSDGRIRRLNDVPGVPAERDLAVRAARLLQERAGIGHGADILIDKRLPMGGGLGGGSSDAATALVALNRLWRADRSARELADLGLELGADVPVFVHGRAAWAEGVGERLTPVDLDGPWFLVIAPPLTVSTAEVFGDPRLTRNTRPITMFDFLSGTGRNDCEAVVIRLHPEVGEVIDWLSEYGDARLTGTGACVFAAFPAPEEAAAVLARLPGKWRGFVARGLSRSPLLERLVREG